jgi:hypothetical protein
LNITIKRREHIVHERKKPSLETDSKGKFPLENEKKKPSEE